MDAKTKEALRFFLEPLGLLLALALATLFFGNEEDVPEILFVILLAGTIYTILRWRQYRDE